MDCPECGRLIYSRRYGVCGYCGEKLPAEMIPSAEDIAAMDAEKKAIQDRLARMDEEKKAEQEKNSKRLRTARRSLLGW